MPSYSLEQTAQDNPSFTPDTDRYGNGKANGEATDNTVNREKEKRELEEEEEDEDPWKVTTIRGNYKKWGELTPKEKVVRVVSYPVRIILVLGFLYLFICSLDFLSSAFKLLGGKKAGEVFQQSDILTNPIAGLMMGVLVTVLVQSSSTSTSIVISMVGAHILTVKTAVPIVMGANIGTSVTNTIVALGQITDRRTFRRAFAGATVHDMFNWLTVIVLLPLEIASGYLFHLSEVIVNSMHLNKTLDYDQDLLKTITKPFTNLIIQINKSGIKAIAKGTKASEVTLLKMCCDKKKPESCCKKALKDLADDNKYGGTRTYSNAERATVCQAVDECVLKDYTEDTESAAKCATLPWKWDNVTAHSQSLNTLQCQKLGNDIAMQECCNKKLAEANFFKFGINATSAEQTAVCRSVDSACFTASNVYDTCTSSWIMGREKKEENEVFDCANWTQSVERTCNKPCEFLFKASHEREGGPLTDEAIGGILLVISLVILCVCLVCIVKLLQSLLQGPMARVIKKFVNANFPGYCSYFTGYLAILIGAGMTILVQSSSIFTSTLTPLVGMGVIELDRMYPLTLGSNIGTTATGVLAALAQNAEDIAPTLQVALCHLFFNISGILIFYPLPFFRPPIPAARFLGNVTADHRWFAVVYLFSMFFLLPLAVFGLSIPGWYVLAAVLIPVGLVVLFVVVVKCLQAHQPSILPVKLRTWEFLPRPLRSLDPYDNCMRSVCFCDRFQDDKEAASASKHKNGAGVTNGGFDGVITTSM